MRYWISRTGVTGVLALSLAALPLGAQKIPPALESTLQTRTVWGGLGELRYTAADTALVAPMTLLLEQARGRTEAYFGAFLREPVAITVVPDRETFTAVLNAEWGVPQTECWMVATGVHTFLVILSPRAWPSEACEHDADDERHLLDILTHEVVHVLHGQNNPTGDFSGAEEIGWFAEGLAVHASGQLEGERLADPAEAVRSGADPKRLVDAWSGQYRYGVSGSMVEFIDQTLGRAKVLQLLPIVDQRGFLEVVGWTEADFLERWRAWVLERAPSPARDLAPMAHSGQR